MTQETKIEYSYPEVLVDTQWVEEHLNDKDIRIVEIDYDPQANYYLGHILDRLYWIGEKILMIL